MKFIRLRFPWYYIDIAVPEGYFDILVQKIKEIKKSYDKASEEFFYSDIKKAMDNCNAKIVEPDIEIECTFI